MRTTVATSCHSTVPLGPIESSAGSESLRDRAGAIVAASLVRPRNGPKRRHFPADPDKTARSSQKRYRTVAQLAHDHLTYTDQ